MQRHRDFGGGVALLVRERSYSSLTLLHKRRVELAWGICYTTYGVERTWEGAFGGLQLHRTWSNFEYRNAQ
jgi:hypothetical protein